MKKFSLILAVIFFTAIASSFQQLIAQDRSREERLQQEEGMLPKDEEKANIHEEIGQQKREMIEHRKSQGSIERALEESSREIEEAMQTVRERFREYDGNHRGTGRKPNDSFAFSFPGFSFAEVFPGDDSERTSWNFSKSLKESSFNRDYVFDVAETAKTVSMSITGYCKAGEIKIRIKMPNGRTYSDIVIDESGNLNWKKSFTITEGENKDKTGDWKYEINASDATGYFRIALQTY